MRCRRVHRISHQIHLHADENSLEDCKCGICDFICVLEHAGMLNISGWIRWFRALISEISVYCLQCLPN